MEIRQLKRFQVKKGVVVGFLLMLLSFHSMGQSRSIFFDIRSAAYKGLQLYSERNYGAAIPFLEQAVKNPKNRTQQPLLLGLAHSYAATGSAKSAAEWYSLLKGTGFELEGEHQLLYANALMASGKHEEGRRLLLDFLHKTGNGSRAEALSNHSMDGFYRDSVRYSVSPVSINSEAAEFSPVIVPYGILFVTERPKAGLVQNRFSADESSGLDIFYGRITDGGDVRQLVRLNRTVNSQMPEGPVAVASNGKKLFYTRSGNKGEMKIFQARSIFNYNTWFDEEVVSLPVKGSVAHPAITDNGQVMYFVSDMPGGLGGTDIYKIERTKKGWSEPRNLGPLINTPANELFPTFHGSDKLYFASNGHFGLGGLDIYEATVREDSVFNVRNMGAPVNSEGDDFGLSLHGSGSWGYFSSNRSGGAGNDDIYRLDVHIITLAGKVYDKTNGKNVSSVKVNLYQDDILLQEAVTDKSGAYSFQLYPAQEYELRYSLDEFRDFSEKISTRQGSAHGTRKWETGLDRKVKMFVLGTVKKSNKARASDASLLIIEGVTGKKDTVVADSRGNYEMELDAFNSYTFWSICDEEAAVANFNTPERGKASLSYYVDIELKPSSSYRVRGLVSAGRGGEKGLFVISRLNKLTMEQDFIFTDERGNFSFDAHSVAEYELCLLHEKNPAPVILTSGWSQKERTVIIGL